MASEWDQPSNPCLPTLNPISFPQPLDKNNRRVPWCDILRQTFFSPLKEELPDKLWKTPGTLCLGRPWGCRELAKRVMSGPRGHMGPNSPNSQPKESPGSLQSISVPGPAHSRRLPTCGPGLLLPVWGTPLSFSSYPSVSPEPASRAMFLEVPLWSDPAPPLAPSRFCHPHILLSMYHLCVTSRFLV